MENRSLNEWYKRVNSIYLGVNFYRSPSSLFMHLTEVVGGLSPLASGKIKDGTDPRLFVPKALGWWMALCGKAGVRDVEAMIWAKFPNCCPYCQQRPHVATCGPNHGVSSEPDWQRLRRLGINTVPNKSLRAWQTLFFDIYPSARADFPLAMSRLMEELAELAEAVRLLPITPKPFLNEASDVFAWLMNVANGLDTENKRFEDRGQWLQSAFAAMYPDVCSVCERAFCACPPLVDGGALRLGEISTDDVAPLTGANILTVSEMLEHFEAGARAIRVGSQDVRITDSTLSELRSLVESMKREFADRLAAADEKGERLLRALDGLATLGDSQKITQAAVDEIVAAIQQIDGPVQGQINTFLNGLGSSIWASALLKLVGS